MHCKFGYFKYLNRLFSAIIKLATLKIDYVFTEPKYHTHTVKLTTAILRGVWTYYTFLHIINDNRYCVV